MKALAIIPARYPSTRFPGKPLYPILGKPMVEWVYLTAKKCKALERIVVATDDKRIEEVVHNFGGEAILTRSDHVSGFDRIVEVAQKMDNYTHYVNVQGDEPLLPPENITGALSLFGKGAEITTTAVPFTSLEDFQNENQVKVVTALDGRALYFSRSPIPFYRKSSFDKTPRALKHQGLYAYSKEALHKMAKLPVAPLEEVESLEQLRFLYHGFSIYVHTATKDSPGVDVLEDVPRVENLLNQIHAR